VRRRDIPIVVGAAALGIWLNQISYVYALTYTNASTVALILGATPIFVALIAFAVGLERLHAGFWLAAVVSFAGVALIALGKEGGVSGSIKGDLLGVATRYVGGATVAIAPLRSSPYRISALVSPSAGSQSRSPASSRPRASRSTSARSSGSASCTRSSGRSC
jgi:drug/metabolite transporter (DMT)-like permease